MRGDLDPALVGLEPRTLWAQFDAIRQIPRPSLQEEAVREYLRALARENDWEVREDDAGNVVLAVAGRGKGSASAPLAIQGHMDMVCEKRTSSDHDFDTQPILLRRATIELDGREHDVLQAEDTTLGSDNGIGCAAGLALALEPGQDHPPLELIFTANEESGMSGAQDLDGSMIRARRLLNLDAEEDGTIYLSCAGGREMMAHWQLDRQDVGHDEVPIRISVDGLHGGHSGVDIHLGRANAIVLAVRLMSAEGVELDGVHLASFSGGGRANAIPRTAEVVVWCATSRAEAFCNQIGAAARALAEEFAEIDSELEVVTEVIDPAGVPRPLRSTMGRAMLKALSSIPDGVIAWSEVIEGLVETSNNIGIFETDEDEMRMVALSRSSRDGAVTAIQERAERKLESSGATVTYQGEYPGWEAKMDTRLLATARETYTRLFERGPEIKAIHAGLECGILGQRIPGVEMISFGPEIRNAHTPDETLVLETMPPFWRFVSALVADLCD